MCVWGGGIGALSPGLLHPGEGVGAQGEAEERGLYFYILSPKEPGCSPAAFTQRSCNPQGIPCLWESGPRLGVLRGPQPQAESEQGRAWPLGSDRPASAKNRAGAAPL